MLLLELKVYYKRNDFWPPTVRGPPDGLATPVGRAGRGLVFRIPASGSEMLVSYYSYNMKMMISDLRLRMGLRTASKLSPAGPARAGFPDPGR